MGLFSRHYTVTGTVTNTDTPQEPGGLDVILYEDGIILSDIPMGYTTTDDSGKFTISFKSRKSKSTLEDELYLLVQNKGLDLHKFDSVSLDEPNNLTVNNKNLHALVNTKRAPGWKGGFQPDNLSDYPMYDNLANIDLLTRQQKVLWPEFSWLAKQGDESSRCYQMFAPDISRIGYTDEGRVYSIICPQQGMASPVFGSLNIEVTVTGTRGWVDEDTKEIVADLRVTGKVWFAPNPKLAPFAQLIVDKLKKRIKFFNHALPFSKADAIHVKTNLVGNPEQPIFTGRQGLSDIYTPPACSTPHDMAWNYANLSIQIGKIWKTGDKVVDSFNQTILNIFNLAKKNILQDGNVLTWNVWFTAPEVVDQKEWGEHAEKWRTSIDADHGSPEGNRSVIRTNADIEPTTRGRGIAQPVEAEQKDYWGEEKALIHELIETHLDEDSVKEIKAEIEKIEQEKAE